MAFLRSLEEDMVLQLERVADAQEDGMDEDAKRAARYYMYRKWVAQKMGNVAMGRGNRFQIPRCVVEHIRARFRENGCLREIGGELYDCKDYTGHRNAPASFA